MFLRFQNYSKPLEELLEPQEQNLSFAVCHI